MEHERKVLNIGLSEDRRIDDTFKEVFAHGASNVSKYFDSGRNIHRN